MSDVEVPCGIKHDGLAVSPWRRDIRINGLNDRVSTWVIEHVHLGIGEIRRIEFGQGRVEGAPRRETTLGLGDGFFEQSVIIVDLVLPS